MITRRLFVASVASALAAPAIVRASSLMPVVPYGRGPAMTALEEMAALQKMYRDYLDRVVNPVLVQHYSDTLIYGSAAMEVAPDDSVFGGLSWRNVPIREVACLQPLTDCVREKTGSTPPRVKSLHPRTIPG